MVCIARTVECTASVIITLILFRELYPGYRTEEINKCINQASRYIENNQKKDGSWFVKRRTISCMQPFVFHSNIHN